MHRMQTFLRLAVYTLFFVAAAWLAAGAARADEKPLEGADWAEGMAAVHARFKGKHGTFAHFGDSITVSRAFWSPLRDEPKNMTPEAARSYRRVKGYMSSACWSNWKGPESGNESAMTIRWAHENVDVWLKNLDPEVALIMFGTNDLKQVELDEFREKTRQVVRRCLQNGTIVILNTIPPRSGMLKESRQYAEAAAAIAREEKLPLVDYFGEVLRRRPDDWDGTLPKFAGGSSDSYEVPTLISRDGVHPSNPRAGFADFSETALNTNGYTLRSYLVMQAYARVIDRVLDPKPDQ